MRIAKTNKHRVFILTATAILYCSVVARPGFCEGRADAGAGVTSDGQHGIYRLLLPESPERHLSLVLNGGYGFTESVGPVSGTHHRMLGGFAIGASPLHWLGISIGLDGFRDSHPADDNGEDATAVGAPYMLLRGGHRIGDVVQLGAALKLTVPGQNAPSMKFSASTLDASLTFAVSPWIKPWALLISAGYRMDNSANVAPDARSLRPGDRLSLSFSDFDAVRLGIGASVAIRKASLFAELVADLLVGDGAPTSASPIHLTVGGRFAVTKGLDLSLVVDPLVSKRPPVGPTDAFAPTPARLSVTAGLAYTFGFDKQAPPSDEPVAEPETVEPIPETVPAPESAKTRLTGTVQDEEGHAVGGASVTLVVADQTFNTESDAEGNYAFENVPVGKGTLTVETYGFTPLTSEIELSATQPTRAPEVLVRPPLERATQIKGLVRSIEGDPLAAKVAISPGGLIVHTDKDGYFLQDLSAGTYTVKITSPGFRAQKKRVHIENESVTILNVELTPHKK